MEKATEQKEAAAANARGVASREPESEPMTSASNDAFETAMHLFSEEKWDGAKESFLSAIELGDTRVSRCRNGVGLCLSMSESATNEELEEALENFARAVEAANAGEDPELGVATAGDTAAASPAAAAASRDDDEYSLFDLNSSDDDDDEVE